MYSYTQTCVYALKMLMLHVSAFLVVDRKINA